MSGFLRWSLFGLALAVFGLGDLTQAGARDLSRGAALRMLDAFAEPIEYCVSRKDTDHAAFRGCIDWHSAVHGTWALIAVMRATGSHRFEDLVHARLRGDLLRQERTLLRRLPRFEMPYGRAWFLRLAIEYERHFGDNRLSAMADETAEDLQAWLASTPPDPWSGSYASQSWALLNLLAYARFRDDAAAQSRAEALARRVLAHADRPCPVRREHGHFMAICTNLAALAADVLTPASFEKWLARLMDGVHLRPVTRAVNAHHLGLNFSRAWGLKAIARVTGEEHWRDLYIDHLEASFQLPDHWNGDYRRSSHWVAQFGVFALIGMSDLGPHR